jgi:hypothetical protein
VAAAIASGTAAERVAADLADLGQEVRRRLGVVVVERGRRRELPRQRAELAAALALLADLAAGAPPAARDELRRWQRPRHGARPGLLTCAGALAPPQAAMATRRGAAGVGLVAWAWERRAVLGPTPDTLRAGVPPAWRPAARRLLAAWDGAVRASSAVEGGPRLLRPHLAVQRTLSPHRLALLAVWHNHRGYARGAPAGTRPPQRSGLTDAPPDWLTALGYPPAGAPLRLAPAGTREPPMAA